MGSWFVRISGRGEHSSKASYARSCISQDTSRKNNQQEYSSYSFWSNIHHVGNRYIVMDLRVTQQKVFHLQHFFQMFCNLVSQFFLTQFFPFLSSARFARNQFEDMTLVLLQV